MLKNLLRNFLSRRRQEPPPYVVQGRISVELGIAADAVSDALTALALAYVEVYAATGDESAVELSLLCLESARQWHQRARMIDETLASS